MFDLLSIKQRKQFILAQEPQFYLNRFKDQVNILSNDTILQIANNKVFLRIPKKEYKWWSPEMTLSFEKIENKSHVREMIGPNPSIFTFTIFMIFGSFLILTFASMMLYSEILMEKPILPSLFVAFVGILVFFSSMFVYSIGKKKAKRQVEKIQQIVTKIIES